MASKVCPVCKTYSSSSNTALNTHIDQCLSGESGMKCTSNPKEIVKPSIKPSIKPRNMRLMSDIYKTAPHCTVEELDARNGPTSWANNSSFPVQELDIQGDEEEKDTTNIVPEVSDHEGDVYIDNNGIKVRILSVPKVNTSNEHRPRKLMKRKDLKLSPSNKKLCSRNPSEVETEEKENDDIEESCEAVMNRDDLPIVRPPWACSKRTILAKRLRANLRTRPLLTKPTSSDSCLVSGSNVKSEGSMFVHDSLSKQNVDVDSCQDSSKRVEQDTSEKTSSENMNILEVKKNEETKISITETSVASESSMALSNSLNLEFPNDLYNACTDDVIKADIEMQQINFQAVDPVPVSKPPTKSYMVSEELQGNSSLASEEQHYYDMSDSSISTISNPILARSDSDKFSVRSSTLLKDDTRGFSGGVNDKYTSITSTTSGDWRSMHTSVFKNDQPCCCSRKEAVSYHESIVLRKHSQMFPVSNYQPPPPLPPVAYSPPMKLAAYNECDSVGSSSKPVLRLMGKNLTVVNTDNQELNYGQFPNIQNEHKFPSHHPMFRSTTYADYFSSSQVGHMIPRDRTHEDRNRFDDQMVINEMNMHKPPSNSITIDDSLENDHNYGGFQAFLPFGKWYRTPTSGSSRSSAI